MNLKIKNVTKKYGDVVALDSFSMTLEEGIYGLLGPNGAGKSTLMNIICTLLDKNEGDVLFNNISIEEQQLDYLNILGYMPQYHQLYEDFTLEEYLFYIGALKGLQPQVIKDRMQLLLFEVGLDDVKKTKLKSFSGGMKQRVMLVQALLNDPKILILDEPTAGLDPKQRIKLRNLIARMSTNKIVLISTHVVSDVEFISKEIILIKEGKCIAHDSSQNLQQDIHGLTKIVQVEEGDVETLQKHYAVSSLYYEQDKLFAKIVLKENQTCKGKDTYPSLEDVYLYHFGDDDESI